jgi:G3E family GTPase
MKPIPVNIISGFLGSGKTTAIIQLLNQKSSAENWAIVVNEFGKISIDGQTLRSKSSAGTVFDIVGGCICCSAKMYLYENLEKIIKTGGFDRIIIEPSGLGGIDMVTEIVETLPDLSLMPGICMVDITGLENPRLQSNMIYQLQIIKADWIVFSKCDLLSGKEHENQLFMRFKSSFPGKSILENGIQISIPSFNRSDSQKKKELNSGILFSPIYQSTDNSYLEQYFQFKPDQIIDPEKLKNIFVGNSSILRAKGHILTKSGKKLINYSLTGYSVEICDESHQNRIVVILQNNEQEAAEKIANQIENCFS